MFQVVSKVRSTIQIESEVVYLRLVICLWGQAGMVKDSQEVARIVP